MAAKVTQKDILERYPDTDEAEKLRANCACVADACVLKGHCRACVTWHREHASKPLPHCLRTLKGVTWAPRE